jgi:hypothetical protein
MQEQEQAIRERAYALWQAAGSPEGREDEFWHQAREELGREPGKVSAVRSENVDLASEESFPASDPANRA